MLKACYSQNLKKILKYTPVKKLRNYFFLMCGLINCITLSSLLKEIFSSETFRVKGQHFRFAWF